jgi:DUF1009 family protein
VHWLSLGELSRLIATFQHAGVTRAVMAGQVKHKQIFSSIRPDWRLAKLLLNLRTRNTDMLLGAVAKVLGDEGIELISSTAFLEPLLAKEGVLTSREPDEEERRNIEYGLSVAAGLAGFDIGQTVGVARRPAWPSRRWKGTDAAIERAGSADADAGSRRLHPGAPADRGEAAQAEAGYALRCAGDRAADAGDDDRAPAPVAWRSRRSARCFLIWTQ